MLSAIYSQVKNALYVQLCSPWIVATDFLLATSIPYIVQFLLWSYLFQSQNSIAGFSMASLQFYYAFAIVFNRCNNGYSSIESISYFAETGNMAPMLTKPQGFFIQRLCAFWGEALLYIPLLMVLLVIYLIYYSYSIKTALFLLLLLLFVVILSSILCFMMAFFLAVFVIPLRSSSFILSLLSTVQVVLGGALLPAQMWPSFLRSLIAHNPFAYIVSAPTRLLLAFSWDSFIQYCVVGGGYILLFYALTSLLWSHYIRNHIHAGG